MYVSGAVAFSLGRGSGQARPGQARAEEGDVTDSHE